MITQSTSRGFHDCFHCPDTFSVCLCGHSTDLHVLPPPSSGSIDVVMSASDLLWVFVGSTHSLHRYLPRLIAGNSLQACG